MKDQLFKNKPDINLLNDIIKLYGLSNLNDTKLFTKENLKDLHTVDKLNNHLERLREYYLPCKSKKYLIDIDEKKCITILRQLLKQYNHNLLAKEKFVKGIKYNFYQIIQYSNKKIDTEKKLNDERDIVISFE